MFIAFWIIYCPCGFLSKYEDVGGMIFPAVPSCYTTVYAKSGWIREIYTILRTVSGEVRHESVYINVKYIFKFERY